MNHGIKYGLLVGVASVVYLVLLHVAGAMTSTLLQSLSWLLLIAGIILAHLSYKKSNQGLMGYGKGLLIGTVVTIVSTVISQIYTYIHIKFIDSELLDYYVENQTYAMEQRGMEPEQIDALAASPLFSAEGFVLMGFLFTVIIGIILSLIIAAITKKTA
jgi:hypothetical protein